MWEYELAERVGALVPVDRAFGRLDALGQDHARSPRGSRPRSVWYSARIWRAAFPGWFAIRSAANDLHVRDLREQQGEQHHERDAEPPHAAIHVSLAPVRDAGPEPGRRSHEQRERSRRWRRGWCRRSETSGSGTPVSGISRRTPAGDHEHLERDQGGDARPRAASRTGPVARSRSGARARSAPGTGAGAPATPSIPSSSPKAARMKSLAHVRDERGRAQAEARCPPCRRWRTRTTPAPAGSRVPSTMSGSRAWSQSRHALLDVRKASHPM